jgi:hypothetical protein
MWEEVTSGSGLVDGVGSFKVNNREFRADELAYGYNDSEQKGISNVGIKTGDTITIAPKSYVYMTFNNHYYTFSTLISDEPLTFVVGSEQMLDFSEGFLSKGQSLILKNINNDYIKPDETILKLNHNGTAAVRGTTIAFNGTDDGVVTKVLDGEIEFQDSKTVISKGNKSKNGVVSDLSSEDITTEIIGFLADSSNIVSKHDAIIGNVTVQTNNDKAMYFIKGANTVIGFGKEMRFENLSEGKYEINFLPILGQVTPPSIPFEILNQNQEISFSSEYQESTSSESKTFSVQLNNNWNLVALPINTTLSQAEFDSKFGNDSVIWTYNNNATNNKWSVHIGSSLGTISIPETINNGIAFIEAGQGFWVKSTTAKTVSFDTTTTNSPYKLTDKEKLLNASQGWHLLGTGTTQTTDAINSENQNISLMWKYVDGAWQTTYNGTLPNGITSMSDVKAGEGVWVLVK